MGSYLKTFHEAPTGRWVDFSKNLKSNCNWVEIEKFELKNEATLVVYPDTSGDVISVDAYWGQKQVEVFFAFLGFKSEEKRSRG